MFISYFFIFLCSLFEYTLLFLASLVKINFIWFNVSAHLTVLQGALPSFVGFNFFTFFYLIFYYCQSALFVLKLPSILGGFCFYALGAQRNLRKIFLCISLIFFILSFIFIFYFKKTFIYTLFWFLAGGFLLLRKKKQISLFESSFISIWLAHALGTLIYGIFCGFLTNPQYVALFPIAVFERIILTFILCLSSIGRTQITYFFDKIKLIYVKKIYQ